MAHILLHQNWLICVGEIAPVHVFTSGDGAELSLNSKSLGRQKKGQYEYPLRWNDVIYQIGEVQVIAYRDSIEWTTETVQTIGAAVGFRLTIDWAEITVDGGDLSFVTLGIVYVKRDVHDGCDTTAFSLSGSGKIVATDDGNPADLT